MASVADLWSGWFHFCHVSFLDTTHLGCSLLLELSSVILKCMRCPVENGPASTFEARPNATIPEPSVPIVAPLHCHSQHWPDLQSAQQGLQT